MTPGNKPEEMTLQQQLPWYGRLWNNVMSAMGMCRDTCRRRSNNSEPLMIYRGSDGKGLIGTIGDGMCNLELEPLSLAYRRNRTITNLAVADLCDEVIMMGKFRRLPSDSDSFGTEGSKDSVDACSIGSSENLVRRTLADEAYKAPAKVVNKPRPKSLVDSVTKEMNSAFAAAFEADYKEYHGQIKRFPGENDISTSEFLKQGEACERKENIVGCKNVSFKTFGSLPVIGGNSGAEIGTVAENKLWAAKPKAASEEFLQKPTQQPMLENSPQGAATESLQGAAMESLQGAAMESLLGAATESLQGAATESPPTMRKNLCCSCGIAMQEPGSFTGNELYIPEPTVIFQQPRWERYTPIFLPPRFPY